MKKTSRLEWISIIYLALFVLAVLTPRLIIRNWFGLEEVQIEESLIFFFGVTGLVTFSLYERLMERREREREEALRERDETRQELVSSYEYIGAVNRQIESLKKLANQTATSVVAEEDGTHKELFQSLAVSAASLTGSRYATIRVVALDRLRTLREYHADAQAPMVVGNKELLRAHEDGKSPFVIPGGNGTSVLIIPSDRQPAPAKTFIIVSTNPEQLADGDAELLKVYANQAELLHHALGRRERSAFEPLALVRETERRSIGQVS